MTDITKKAEGDSAGVPKRALELLIQAQQYAEEVFHGRLRKDDREGLAFNLKSEIREYLLTLNK